MGYIDANGAYVYEESDIADPGAGFSDLLNLGTQHVPNLVRTRVDAELADNETVRAGVAAAIDGEVGTLVRSSDFDSNEVAWAVFDDDNRMTKIQLGYDGKPTQAMADAVGEKLDYLGAEDTDDEYVSFIAENGRRFALEFSEVDGAPSPRTIDIWAPRISGEPFAPKLRALPAEQKAQLAGILNNSLKYNLVTWVPSMYGNQAAQPYINFGGIGEGNLRPPASVAYGLGIALRVGAYNAAATGVSEADARAMCIRLSASIAHRHKANTAGGWGGADAPWGEPPETDFNSWQAALWAFFAGAAAWMIWDHLTATDRDNVTKMVVSEANRFLRYTVPYWTSPTGYVNTPGDSKAEENTWNAKLLALAFVMQPTHPNSGQWMERFIELMSSRLAVPSDLTGRTTLHGNPLREVINGWNANEDGSVVNHAIIHPDYMCSGSEGAAIAGVFALAGMRTPVSVFHNTQKTYLALTDLVFPTPTYAAPGGTIYIPGSDQLYFPQGNDWGPGRVMNYAAADVMAHCLTLDDDSTTKAAAWAARHLARAAAMQARGTTGQTYQDAAEDTYYGREQWVVYNAANALLIALTAEAGTIRTSNVTAGLLAAQNRGL